MVEPGIEELVVRILDLFFTEPNQLLVDSQVPAKFICGTESGHLKFLSQQFDEDRFLSMQAVMCLREDNRVWSIRNFIS